MIKKRKVCKKTTKRGKWAMEYNVKVAVTPVKKKKKGAWSIGGKVTGKVPGWVLDTAVVPKREAISVARKLEKRDYDAKIVKTNIKCAGYGGPYGKPPAMKGWNYNVYRKMKK